MRASRGTAAVVAAIVVLGSLAACSPAASPEADEQPFAEPAVVEVADAPEQVVMAPGITVATGTLQSADGRSSGQVTVVSADDGDFDLVIDDFVSPISAISVNFATEPFTEARYCEVTQVIYGFGDVQPAPRITMSMDFGGSVPLDDPSFFDTLLLVVNESDAPRTGCFYPVFASADLVWTMPDLRPDIQPIDSGPTGGAMGTVETDGDRLLRYTVAPGDVMAEVAARFGITVADIFWLSPTRRPNSEDPVAYAFEVFNLDKAARAVS